MALKQDQSLCLFYLVPFFPLIYVGVSLHFSELMIPNAFALWTVSSLAQLVGWV